MFETLYNDPISYSVIMTVLSGFALLFFLPILFGCIFFLMLDIISISIKTQKNYKKFKKITKNC